jgi:RNA polymerase sigma-70 factor (ECF subfamily)
MERISDIALVTQVAVFNNQRAFDQLVRKYQSPVRRFLLHLTLGDESLSDDLSQETFLKAYTHIGQFRAMSSFQTWLFRIAYRVFYDYQRSLKFRVDSRMFAASLDSSQAVRVAEPQLSAPNPTLKMDIYQALSQLSEEERTCITLQLIEGQSIDHIANITGINGNTVKSLLKRGKEKVAKYLRNNGYD